jgi:hypothetical protein
MPVRKRFEKRRQMLGDDAADWLRGGDGGAWIYFQTADELAALWHDHGGRIQGIGVPKYEALAHGPAFHVGVPDMWVSAWEVSYYNGRSVDVHGKPIGTEYAEGHFPYLAIDPKDPPMYESEAAFLDRRGLFLPGERRRLKRADFALESILDIFDLELDG